tara:strand:+ start:282 stop:527 length:246 start_codon:yes stop_codon:yes gene_type:complete
MTPKVTKSPISRSVSINNTHNPFLIRMIFEVISIERVIAAIPNKVKESNKTDLIIHLYCNPPGSIEPSEPTYARTTKVHEW